MCGCCSWGWRKEESLKAHRFVLPPGHHSQLHLWSKGCSILPQVSGCSLVPMWLHVEPFWTALVGSCYAEKQHLRCLLQDKLVLKSCDHVSKQPITSPDPPAETVVHPMLTTWHKQQHFLQLLMSVFQDSLRKPSSPLTVAWTEWTHRSWSLVKHLSLIQQSSLGLGAGIRVCPGRMGVGGAGISFQAVPIDFWGFSSPEPAKTAEANLLSDCCFLPLVLGGEGRGQDSRVQGTLPPYFSTWRRLYTPARARRKLKSSCFCSLVGFWQSICLRIAKQSFLLDSWPAVREGWAGGSCKQKVWQRERSWCCLLMLLVLRTSL